MVDIADLKSADHYDREGSSPSSLTMKLGGFSGLGSLLFLGRRYGLKIR